MRIVEMTPMVYDHKEYQKFYKKIRLNGIQNSHAIAIPAELIKSIAINQTGTASIYLTNNSLLDVEDDKSQWVLWDGESEINIGITAIKCENTSGVDHINITVSR